MAGFIVMGVAPARLEAATWLTEPFLRLGAGVHDNTDLSSDSIGTVYTANVATGLTFRRVTELLDVSAAATVGYTEYFGNEEAPKDRDFQLLQLGSAYKQERNTWRMDGSYRRDATFVDVQAPVEAGTDPGSDIDTGLTEASVRRERLFLNPAMERAFTRRLDGGLEYAGIHLAYEDQGNVDLPDTWTHDIQARLAYQFTERANYGIELRNILFRSEDEEDELDTYSLSATGDYRLTELSTVNFILGARYSEPGADAPSTRDTSTGFIGRFTAHTRGERWSGAATLERDLRPSGDGRLREADQIRLRASRQMAPRWEASIAGRAYETRVPGDDEVGEESYAELSPAILWRLTPSWTLSGTYRYRWIDRAVEQGTVSANAAFITLEYRPPSEVPDV